MKNNIKFQKYIYNIWHKHISFDDNKFVIHNKNKQQQKKTIIYVEDGDNDQFREYDT